MINKITARKIVDKLLNGTEDGQEVDLEYLKEQLNKESIPPETLKEAMKILESSVQAVITKQQDKAVRVVNFPESQPFPEEINVNNLNELESYFKAVEETIKSSLNINLPAPQVTVNPPSINIPETKINIPPLDLTVLLTALYEIVQSLSKLNINDKSHPLAVRLTDGANWVKELIRAQQETSKAVAAFAGGSDQVRLLDVNKNPVNPATADSPGTLLNGKITVTTAGTSVQLTTSTASKSVTIKALAANTGTIYVGNTTVASTNGYTLAASQAISFDIDNLSKVYLDCSVNGEGVTYLAVN